MGYSGASHFASNADYEVQRTNHFELLFTGFLTASQAEKLRLSVESVSIPSINIETTELKKGNATIKVANAPSVDTGSLVFKDAIGADLEKSFYDWLKEVYDIETEVMGNVSEYKKTLRLLQYSPNEKIVRTWRLEGCFPLSLEAGEFTYGSPDKKLITCTLSVDKAIRE